MLTSETRRSETKNRLAVITPHSYPKHHYAVAMTEKGRIITREHVEKASNITKARQIAREWCR